MNNQNNPPFVSDRQRTILYELAKGKAKKEIGKDLYMSRHNVERIVVNLREKFSCQNTTHLIAFCIAKGVLEAEKCIDNRIADGSGR